MKALKVVLVAALVSLTMLGFAQSTDIDRPVFESKYVSITDVKPLSALDYAIRAQVDYSLFLFSHERSGFYIANVKISSRIIKVRGTYKEWKSYFIRKRPMLPSETVVKNKGRIE